jgi:hypothetical protein
MHRVLQVGGLLQVSKNQQRVCCERVDQGRSRRTGGKPLWRRRRPMKSQCNAEHAPLHVYEGRGDNAADAGACIFGQPEMDPRELVVLQA